MVQMNFMQKRNRLTGIENKTYGYQRGKGRGGWNKLGFRISRYRLLYIK